MNFSNEFFKVVIFFIIILSVSNTFAQEQDTLYIGVFAVNLRSGPGLEFEKAGVLYLNAPVFKKLEEGTWYQIYVSDTLEGWIFSRFTTRARVTGFARDKILYNDADIKSKIGAVKRMTAEHKGAAFEFLQDVIINHDKHDLGVELDSLVLPEIFRGWAENSVEEAMPTLVYVMEQDLKGEIGRSLEAINELKIAAKDAIKLLVRVQN